MAKNLTKDNQRGRWVAIATGVISISLAIAYLLLVQLLDFRGEMLPAPLGEGMEPGPMGAIAAPWVTQPLFPGGLR